MINEKAEKLGMTRPDLLVEAVRAYKGAETEEGLTGEAAEKAGLVTGNEEVVIK